MSTPLLPLLDPYSFTDLSLIEQMATLRPIAEGRLIEDGIEAPAPPDLYAVFGVETGYWRYHDADQWQVACAMFDAYFVTGFLLGQMASGFRPGGAR